MTEKFEDRVDVATWQDRINQAWEKSDIFIGDHLIAIQVPPREFEKYVRKRKVKPK